MNYRRPDCIQTTLLVLLTSSFLIGMGFIALTTAQFARATTANYTITPIPAIPAHALTRAVPAGTPTCITYSYITSTATIVPGTTDVGNHCDTSCYTSVTLPFPFQLYDRTFTSIEVSSKGNIYFLSDQSDSNNECLRSIFFPFFYTIFAHWDDLRTDTTNSGIFTSISGSAPNRIFNIEWRATYASDGGSANFEVRLYESLSKFDIVYGALSQSGSSATVGVMQGPHIYTQYSCNMGVLTPGLQVSFLAAGCTTPTPVPPTSTPLVSPTPTSVCDPVWTVVDSPHPGDDNLLGVAAVSANDVWAVGNYSENNIPKTLTLHWDGNQWSVIPSPNVGTQQGITLNGIDAISANDVWAVGYYISANGPWRTLILHWDGKQWVIVPSPNKGTSSNTLRGVAAISANDVWAVGYYDVPAGDVTLVEHWSGSQWDIIPSPNIGDHYNELWNVSAAATNDVWAVGIYRVPTGGEATLILHWDGTQWTIVPSPNPPGANQNLLYSVSALSPSDAWAVGYYNLVSSGNHTLIEHWNGASWTIIPSPDPVPADNYLYGVSARTANDAWAVGYYISSTRNETLILHWDGTAWSEVPSPNPGTIINELWGVSAISTNDVWAVGVSWSGNGTPFVTLTEHYAIPSECSTPSPTPTYSPTMTPTASPMLVAHVNWEARPPQPDKLQVLPITLTLKLGATEVNYPTQLTDRYGFFTVTLGALPNGTYTWRADDSVSALHSPNYLANSGTVNLTGALVTSVEMGLMRVGDANDDNRVNITDFNMLKLSFGSTCGDPAYDNRADFTGDCQVNIADFNPLKTNFGHNGAPPVHGQVQVVHPRRER